MPESSVIDQSFLIACRRLRLSALGLRPFPRKAETSTALQGQGLDYRDHRPYVNGDDPRRIDWPLYQRSGRLFLRLYDEPHQLGVLILVDCSASMGFEERPRLIPAQQVAVALAAAGLEELNRISIQPFANGQLLGSPLTASSRTRLTGLARRVAEWQPEQNATSQLADVFDAVQRAHHSRLLLIVISDFFDASGVNSWVPALKETRHLPALIQLTRASDSEPELNGSLELEDCETSHRLHINITSGMAKSYRDAYRRFDESMELAASETRGRRIVIDADRPILPQLGALSSSGRIQLGSPVMGTR